MNQNILEAIQKEVHDRWGKFIESYVAAAVQTAEQFDDALKLIQKEAPTMQVTYNGFTGELVKLERHQIPGNFIRDEGPAIVYDLSLYDSEKQATISFTGVKLEDVQFHGGAVTFGG